MSSRFPLLHPDQLSQDQQRLYETITAGPRAGGPFGITHADGTLAGPFNALLFAPVVGDAVQQLGAVLRFGGGLPDRTRELVICTVAVALDSDYEWHAHSRAAIEAGVAAAELRELEAGSIPETASEAEAAALELTRQLIAEAGITADARAKAQQHLSHAGITELTVLVGYYRTLAWLLLVAGVDHPVDAPPTRGSFVDDDEHRTIHPSRIQGRTP